MKQNILFTNNVAEALEKVVEKLEPISIFVLVDTNTAKFVLPQLQAQSELVKSAKVITIPAGDINKNLDTLTLVWRELTTAAATRNTLLINIGGGVVTDLGGFAAATYKRGMFCVNIPTTLLAAVDAAVGGKTGINFNGLKNQVGAFKEPDAVIVSTCFFNTLPEEEMLSGYAELLKHSLLKNKKEFARALRFNPRAALASPDDFLNILRDSVKIKANIVKKDPTEKGLRKSLNLGHTAGHAFEELSLERANPIPHGYAVAWGLVIDAIISSMLLDMNSEILRTLVNFVKDHYGIYNISCKDYPTIIKLMRHDKKNIDPDHITFTLLKEPGKVMLNAVVSTEQISAALDIYRDIMGI
jgi:3-dehydroquinate synthase